MNPSRKPYTGYIYFDRSSKGGRRRTVKTHNRWRAVITVRGRTFRKRFKDLELARGWLHDMVEIAKGGNR